MSDQPSLADELLDESSGTVYEGNVVNNGTSEPAWQPQTTPPAAARSRGRKSLTMPKISRRAPKGSRPASTPSAPSSPRKSADMGRKIAGASRRGAIGYGRFLDAALMKLDKVASACTTVMLLAAFAAYLAFRPTLEQLAISFGCGIAMLVVLLPFVHRLYVWRERGTFLAGVGAILIGLLLLAVAYAAVLYVPQYVSGMAASAVPVLWYADAAGRKLQQRKYAEREAEHQAEVAAAADAREQAVRSELQSLFDSAQSKHDSANAQLSQCTAWMQQLVTVAPQLQEMANSSRDILTGLKVKQTEVEEAIKGRVEKEKETHINEWTQTAKSHLSQHIQTQVDQAVAANQKQNDGTIALRDQRLAELGAQVQQLVAAHAQVQQELRTSEQKLAQAEADNQALANENNRLQREKQEASYGPETHREVTIQGVRSSG